MGRDDVVLGRYSINYDRRHFVTIPFQRFHASVLDWERTLYQQYAWQRTEQTQRREQGRRTNPIIHDFDGQMQCFVIFQFRLCAHHFVENSFKQDVVHLSKPYRVLTIYSNVFEDNTCGCSASLVAHGSWLPGWSGREFEMLLKTVH